MEELQYTDVKVKIELESQYHLGSGYGLSRVIDSLLWLDGDGVPVIPGTTMSGLVGQSLFDLLHFSLFKKERGKLCDFQLQDAGKNGPLLPCAIAETEPCLLCDLMGSPAQPGVVQWQDFPCVSHAELLRPMLKSGKYSVEERTQVIAPYAGHKQDRRTGTVKERHFFVNEEGAALCFEAELTFSRPLSPYKTAFLAMALANVRAVGRRKSRGKGVCRVTGCFTGSGNETKITKTIEDLINNNLMNGELKQ